MRRSTALALTFAAALIVFFLWTGIRPNALPFIPGARFSDAVTSHLPAAGFLRHSISAEEAFPVWRPTTFAGAPFAANPLNKTAYPLQWGAAILPADLFLDMMILLHMGIAACGMFLWVRGVGLRIETAAFCALAYSLSPRFIAHLGAGHLDIVYAMAWLPCVMESVRFWVTPNAKVPPLLRMITLAVCAALMILSDVRVGAFGLVAAGFYAVYLAIQHKPDLSRSVIGSLGVVGIVGCLIAALVVPLILWSPYLSRSGLTQAEAGIFALEPLHFLAMLLPLQRSNPETLTYLGLPALILALAGIVTQFRQRGLWIVLIVVFALYAMGANGGLWSLLTGIFPPLLWFRVPSRAWIIVTLIVVLLAGYGLDRLFGLIAKRGVRQLTLPFALMFALTFVDLAISGRNWLEWRTGDDWLLPYVPLGDRLLELQPDRIYDPAYSFPQDIAELYYMQVFGGVDPFQIDGVARAIREAGGIHDDAYSVVQPPLVGVTDDDFSRANQGALLDLNALAAWAVSHVIAPYDIEQAGLTFIDSLNGVRIYQVDAYQPDTLPQDAFPRWAARQDLPTSLQISEINAATVGAHVVSWIGFTLCGLIAAWSRLRQRVKS